MAAFSPTAGASSVPSENAPGRFPLQLGSVFFWTGECPEDLPIGAGSQMEQTHTVVGGGRVVQTFGPSADDVMWTGKFFDANVAIRNAQLRLYMTNGIEIFVSYKAEQYYAIVKDFKPNYRGGYGTYTITLIITRDANGAFTVTSPISIDSQVSALFAQANGANQSILTSIADSPTPGATPTETAQLALSPPSIDAANAMQPAMTNLQATIQNAGPIAANIVTAGPAIVAAAQSASEGITAFQNTLEAGDPNIVNAALLQASVTAIGLNAQRGQTTQQTTVQGTSTFKVAALQYGDVSQAYQLAQSNGLVSPFIAAAASQQLSLPPFQSAA